MLNAAGAQAQAGFPGAPAPGADLRRNLETLAANPNSVQALTDAGRAALDMGDGEAALGFFTRANQIMPGNPRVKLGLAAANARSGRPQNAIMLFSEAQAMGIPVGEIAGERGLAYDLLGQPANAQQDYVAALRYRENPEIRRRLALSLAISGQREAALNVLGDQLRRGDRGALRTRAFVLALSGDTMGASEAARTSMPPGTAQAMAPFFQRLASLSPGAMASAAHLGRFPSFGGFRMAGATRPASDPGALAFAGGGVPPQNVALAARLPVAVPVSTASRRRPGSAEASAREGRRRAASETRTLARSSTTPAASRGARRTIDRWELSGRGATRSSSVQQRSAERRETRPAGTPTPSVFQPALSAAITATPLTPSTTPSQAALPAPQPQTVQTQPALTMNAPTILPHPYEPVRRTAPSVAAPVLNGTAAAPIIATPSPASGPVSTVPEPQAAALVELAGRSEAAVNLPIASSAAPAPEFVLPAGQAAPASAVAASVAAADPALLNASVELAGTAATQPAAGPPQEPAAVDPVQSPAVTSPQRPVFADVVAALSALPEAEAPAARSEPLRETPPARRPADRSDTRATATLAAARSTPAQRTPRAAQPAHPARTWVQLAAAPRTSLAAELNRFRRLAPELLRGRNGYTAPLSASNDRLLVGPFETAAEARTFINRLKDEDIASYSWSSSAGQQVERLPAGR